VLLARYLVELGFSGLQVGVLVTSTLLGSAVLTLVAGLRLTRFGARSVLLSSCALMAATGVGFGTLTWFWPRVVVGFVGTLNPSGGDVSLFLPTEQAALASLTPLQERAHRFGIYNLSGTLAGAAGALLSALPERLADDQGWSVARTERLSFLVYVVVAAAAAGVYLRMGEHLPGPTVQTGLHKSRAVVIRLSLLFSIDSAGGGFALQSLLVLYLYLRFNLSPAATGATLAATGVLSAFSQLVSARIARRIGLVRTMVFTHLPANVCLILAGLVPNAAAAIAFLLVRSALSQMDVPARQALVMRLVEPDERAAAASVTNVPRSLGSAATPALAGALLDWSHVGWPLVIGGAMKAIYDLLLLAQPLDRD
jgi:MFS family permease